MDSSHRRARSRARALALGLLVAGLAFAPAAPAAAATDACTYLALHQPNSVVSTTAAGMTPYGGCNAIQARVRVYYGGGVYGYLYGATSSSYSSALAPAGVAVVQRAVRAQPESTSAFCSYSTVSATGYKNCVNPGYPG